MVTEYEEISLLRVSSMGKGEASLWEHQELRVFAVKRAYLGVIREVGGELGVGCVQKPREVSVCQAWCALFEANAVRSTKHCGVEDPAEGRSHTSEVCAIGVPLWFSP